MNRKLEGRVALVTGASHPRGIGAAVAASLGEAGAKVVVSDLEKSRSSLDDVVSTLGATGLEVAAIAADVTSVESVQALANAAASRFGRLDILVNNAGIGIGSGQFLENDDAVWQETLDVNLLGAARVTRECLPYLLERESSSIVNVSSLCGLRHIAGIPAPYTASKFAVVGFTKAIALEFGPQGLRCNAVCPGSVDTQMRATILEMSSSAEGVSLDDADAEERATISLGRPAEPSEIASVVAFLASPDASYLNGTAVPVDGGMWVGL